MATLASLIVALGIDTSGYEDGLEKAKGKATGLGGVLKGVMGGVGAIALGVGAAGIGALGTGLGIAITEAIDAQQVMAQLDAVLQSTGGAAGVTRDTALGLADSLSMVTRFDDEAILSGENLLLTFTNIGQNVFPQTTQTMLDMSQALGIDLNSSATMLGKALQDPILGVGALRRVGVNFSEDQQNMIKSLVESGNALDAQKMILQELQVEFGGSAEAAGQTFAGQLDILKNQLLNVAESTGNTLLPVLSEAFKTLTPYISDFANEFADFVKSDRFQEWVEKAVDWLKNDLPEGIKKASDFWNNELKPAVDEFWPILRDDVLPALGELSRFLGVVLPPIMKAFTGGWGLQIDAFKVAKQWLDLQIDSIMNLGKNILTLIDLVKEFASNLLDLALPDWITPGSPTPFEMGLRGIDAAMGELNRQGLPRFNAQLSAMPMPALAGINPISGASGAMVINFYHQPLISTASEYEAERILGPAIERKFRELMQR